MISTRLLEARGGTPVLNTLIDNRSDPGVRSVLLDFYLDRGCLPARLGLAIDVGLNAAADAAAADAADAADAAAADAAAAAAEQILVRFAENVVQILIEMKAPGTFWL